MLLTLGLYMSVLTFVTGEYLAPWAEGQADKIRLGAQGRSFGRIGAWLKEHREGLDGQRAYSINVGGVDSEGRLLKVRIFEHDGQGLLLSRIEAEAGQISPASATQAGQWLLRRVSLTRWPALDSGQPLQQSQLAELAWPTTLSPGVVSAAVSSIDGMSTLELWRYSRHLSQQEQTSQRYELQFWKRALYPLACIVMMALALPFAYLHARAGGVSLKVFGGIMLGISFVLLNNVAGHLGVLHNWTPWLAASVPSLIYLGLSLAAFGWLVRYR